MISLSDLKAKRAAMTQGEWERIGHTFASPGFDVGWCTFGRDATGIVATHNAADVLIEIAEAALTFDEATETLRLAHFDAVDGSGRDLPRLNREHSQAKARLRTALAKVRR